jgi:hypothetical protein
MKKYRFHTTSDMRVYFSLHTREGKELWNIRQKAYELSEAYDDDEHDEDFVKASDEFDAAAKIWEAENADLIEWID